MNRFQQHFRRRFQLRFHQETRWIGPPARFSAAAGLALFFLAAGSLVAAQGPKPPVAASDGGNVASAYASAAALQDQGLVDLAAAEWQALIASQPAADVLSRARFNLGVCRFQSADYTAAAKHFGAVADPQAHPELAEQALANLGLAWFNAGVVAEADAKAVEGAAASSMALTRSLEAFATLQAAFPKGDQAPVAGYYRGRTLALLGRHAEAADQLRQTIARFPASPLRGQLLLELGASLLELNQLDEAEARLTELLTREDPDALRGEAFSLRGEARLAAGNFLQAAEDFGEAARTPGVAAPDDATLRQGYCLYRAGRFEPALKVYDRVVSTWPESPLAGEAKLAAAKCLLKAARPREAATRLSDLWRSQPTAPNVAAAHWLARAVLEADGTAQEIGAAREAVDAALATRPDKTWAAELAFDRADLLYADAGSKPSAAEAYAAIGERYRGQPIGDRAACLAAHTSLELGDAAKAAELARGVLETTTNAELRLELLQIAAEAYRLLPKPAEAAEAYKLLLAAAADDERAAEWTFRLAQQVATNEPPATIIALLTPVLDQLSPSSFPPAAMLLADAYRRAGGGDKSIALLKRVIDEAGDTPALPRALYERGRQTAETNRQAAVSDFARVYREHGNDPLAPYARLAHASLRFADGAFGECITIVQPVAASADPPAGEARFLLARALVEQGDHAAALPLTATATAPEAERLFLRGVCESRLGRIRDCEATFAKCLEAVSGDQLGDRVLYELAWIQHGQNAGSRSAELFSRLAEEHPASPLVAEAWYRVGEWLYRSGKFAEAERKLAASADAADTGEPGDDPELRGQALHLLGWTRHELADHAGAAQAFERQLALNAEGKAAADARLMLAECANAQGDAESAGKRYPLALQDDLLRGELRALGALHYGQLLGRNGEDWQAALDAFAMAGEAPSTNANELTFERAWALQKLGRRDEAMPLLRKVAESASSPLAARARFIVGELQFAENEYEQAVRTFYKVAYGYGGRSAPAAYHEWQAQSLFEAARCLELLGKADPAVRLYAEVIDRFPDSEKAVLARDRLQPSTAE